jgi:hypothetical protein
VLSQFQPRQEGARQAGGHGELFLRQTTASSQSLELFAETMNRAHGTSEGGKLVKRLLLDRGNCKQPADASKMAMPMAANTYLSSTYFH